MNNQNKNKVTTEVVNRKIVAESYLRLPSGKTMICELTLENGYTVRGESNVVDPENFIEELGRQYSREKAVDAIWELEGYLLQEELYREKVSATRGE